MASFFYRLFYASRSWGFQWSFSHSKGKTYYLEVLVENYWPWLLFLPFSCVTFVRKASKEQKVFVLVWIFIVTISLMFRKPEYGRYLLLIYPLLSVIIGMSFSKSIPRLDLMKLAQRVTLISVFSFFILDVFPIKLHREKYADLRDLRPLVHFYIKEGLNEDIQLVYSNPRVYSVVFYLDVLPKKGKLHPGGERFASS